MRTTFMTFVENDKVIVMTGNSKVNEKFRKMWIDVEKIKILYKPVAFNALAEELKKTLNIVTTRTTSSNN